jgi:hypothetical protein
MGRHHAAKHRHDDGNETQHNISFQDRGFCITPNDRASRDFIVNDTAKPWHSVVVFVRKRPEEVSMRSTIICLAVVIILHCLAPSPIAAQIPGSLIRRVLLIHTQGGGQGTAFTVDVNGRQYLITAKHMVTNMGSDGIVNVTRVTSKNGLVQIPYHMQFFRCDDPTDIAVLIPPEQLTAGAPIDWSSGALLGTDAYFVGFPVEMTSRALNDYELGFPVPLVKKGVVSGADLSERTDIFYLDGYNIFGFSGSPVVYRDSDGKFKLLAVIAGFKPDYGPLLVPHEIAEAQVSPQDESAGLILRNNVTHQVYLLEKSTNNEGVRLNTGIVTTFAITRAIELIKKHEIGPKINSDFKPLPVAVP